ncbi:MAG: L,D-transpeptidase family protein [Candidatus Binatia bacterium]
MKSVLDQNPGRIYFRRRGDDLGGLVRVTTLLLVLAALVRVMSVTLVHRIVVSKSAQTLVAYDAEGNELARHAVILGASPVGTKGREGDRRTPEGDYRVCFKNPQSKFHLSLGLDYPNVEDARRGLAEGAIEPADYVAIVEAHRTGKIPPWKTPLGGEIFIHGDKGVRDATAGCIALTNEAIEDLYLRVELGTPVTILP